MGGVFCLESLCQRWFWQRHGSDQFNRLLLLKSQVDLMSGQPLTSLSR